MRPARLLAPLSLIVCIVAVLVVVQSTLSDDAETSTPVATTTTQRTTTTPARKTYRVRSGDTLGAIAERTGVPVDRLVELNPDVDPQSLRTGQRIRLRE